MVAEDYMIVYLNGATPHRRMPGLGWLKKCYQMIDRRLRKNLKSFIILHPSWFIRTVLTITKPFIRLVRGHYANISRVCVNWHAGKTNTDFTPLTLSQLLLLCCPF